MQGQPAMSTFTASTLSKLSEAYESPVYLSPACTPHGMTNKKSQNALHEAFQNMLITLHLALSPSTSFDKKKAKATCPTPCQLEGSSVLLAKVFAPQLRWDWPNRMMGALLHKSITFVRIQKCDFHKRLKKNSLKLSLSTCLLVTGLKAEQIRPILESDPYYKGSRSGCIACV